MDDRQLQDSTPELTVHRMVSEANFLTAIGEIVLTDQSGKQTHYAYCDVWRFRSGKLAALHAFVTETQDDISAIASEEA